MSWTFTASSDRALLTRDRRDAALDRLIAEVEDHGDWTNPERTIDFTYLGLTDLATDEEFSDSTGALWTKRYSYDAYNARVAMTHTPTAGPVERFTYGYDPHGSVSLLLDENGASKPSTAMVRGEI